MKRNFTLPKVLTTALCVVVSALMLTSCNEGCTKEEKDGNAVIETIMTRTSVRAYEGKTIGNDTIETLLRAAMAAPSAVNRQPWAFAVITDRDRMKAIGDSLPNASRMLNEAPVAIVVLGDSTRFIPTHPEYWVQDCSAATENLLLAAHSMGLGAVWCGIYPVMARVKSVKEIMNLSDNLVPLCVVPLGYPAEDPEPKDKWDASKIIWE